MRNVGFLILGIFIVSALTYLKYLEEPPSPSKKRRELHTEPLQAIPHDSVVTQDHRAYVAKEPVSKAAFSAFAKMTAYVTWREKHGLSPTWRDGGKGPVLWLTRLDAESFCLWLSRQHGQQSPYLSKKHTPLWQAPGFRLPSVDELMHAHSNNPSQWEWTNNTLYDVDSSRALNHRYLTIWRPGGGLKYRRIQDFEEAITFRIAWTQNE